MNRPQQLDLEPPHRLGFLQRTSAVDSEPELFCYNFCDCDVTTQVPLLKDIRNYFCQNAEKHLGMSSQSRYEFKI